MTVTFAAASALASLMACALVAAPAHAAQAATAPPVYDIPHVAGLTIDGDPADWADRGFAINMMSHQFKYATWSGQRPRVRVGWSEQGLALLIHVPDQHAVEAADQKHLYRADSIDVYLQDRVGGDQRVQVLASPGRAEDQPAMRFHVYDRRDADQPEAYEPTVASQSFDDGYIIEALLPLAPLGVTPEDGAEAALQININDVDIADRGPRAKLIWFPLADTAKNNRHAHRIRLAQTPSDPVNVAATGGFRNGRVEVEVLAAADHADARATLLLNGGVVSSAALRPTKEGYAANVLHVDLPPLGQELPAVRVAVDGKQVQTLEIPDFAFERAQEIARLQIGFDGSVFSGDILPKPHVVNPLLAENLLGGPFTLEATYLDANGNLVERADRPGRYGGVVQLHAYDGRTLTRYATLYCRPADFSWWELPFRGPLVPHPALGVDPDVTAAYGNAVARVVGEAIHHQQLRTDEPAVLYAGLAEASPDEPATVWDDPVQRNRRWWLDVKRQRNGSAERYADVDFVAPRPIEASPAPELRPGTAEEAGFTADFADKLDALLNEWADNSDEAFIVCIARHGVIAFHKAYGTRDGQPMTVDTPSYMASLTKLLHGAAIMMLVDQGLIDLDAPVQQYLPEFADVQTTQPLTVRRLMTHTAGTWEHWGDTDPSFEEKFAEAAPFLPIGERVGYNGMSLALASKILEQIIGQTMADFYRARLIEPLGMHNTTILNSSWHSDSTALDMAKFGQMLLTGAYGDDRYMSEQTRDAMLPRPVELNTPSDLEWGIGCIWFSKGVDADSPGLGERTFGHGAASDAVLRIDLDNDLVIATTRNRGGENFVAYHSRFMKLIADSLVQDE